MFERIIYTRIEEQLDILVAKPKILKLLLSTPGWEEDEIDAIVATWVDGAGKPAINHNYARVGGRFPCYSIVLADERQNADYLGEGLHIDTVNAEAAALAREIAEELGRPVSIGVQQWAFTFAIYSYAEHPEVALACHTVLRWIMQGAGESFYEAGADSPPQLSGNDLMPDPRYMPENFFARQMNVNVTAHLAFSHGLNLGPWQTGRAKRVRRIHVDNNVTGVNPGVTPYDPNDE